MRGLSWSNVAKGLGLGVVAAVMAMVALEAPLVAGPAAEVPEIGGASLSAGLALLGGGMLWLRARRNLK